MNDASTNVRNWEIEHKKYLCVIIKKILTEVWETYGVKGSKSLTKEQFKRFLVDFVGITNISRSQFAKILKVVDYDRSGKIEEIKMGMFIINVSNLSSIIGEKEMEEALMEEA